MKELVPGHVYNVDVYDGLTLTDDLQQSIMFMNRLGEGYPGNLPPAHPGTNCQELLRVLHSRVTYLNQQHLHVNNFAILQRLEECLWLFEDRAAERHGISQFDARPDDIMTMATCCICGHVVCKGH